MSQGRRVKQLIERRKTNLATRKVSFCFQFFSDVQQLEFCVNSEKRQIRNRERFQASSKSIKITESSVETQKNYLNQICKIFVCKLQRETKKRKIMTKLNIEIEGEVEYHGSKVFASLADALGLSIDLVWKLFSLKYPLHSACHSHPLGSDDNFEFSIHTMCPLKNAMYSRAWNEKHFFIIISNFHAVYGFVFIAPHFRNIKAKILMRTSM